MECQANDIRFFLLPRIQQKAAGFQIPPLPVSRDVFAAVRRYPRLFMAVVAHFILAHIVAYLHGAHTVFMRASSTCAESSSFTFMLFFTC